MPSLVTACSQQPCPHPAVDRGRCSLHRRTTSERGYGAVHQAERQAALPGASCEHCGSTDRLHRDHRIPLSVGGTNEPDNLRWLCASCHAAIGLRLSSRAPVS